MPTDREIDGVDLLPYLTGRSRESAHDWLAWESHNDKWVRHGYRKGPWKLRMMRLVGQPAEQTPIELYDLSTDLGERDNLVRKRPDKLKELLQELAVWEHDVGIGSMIYSQKADGAQSNESIVPGP